MNGNQSKTALQAAAKKKGLWRVLREAERFEFGDPLRSQQVIDEFVAEIDDYSGAPDIWHTMAMVAGRVGHYDARITIVQAGLKEWPDDTDLLCEELQARYGHAVSYDPAEATRIWARLSDPGTFPKVAPFWRYWCYGAVYHAIELNDSKGALDLLDKGLLYTRRADLANIFRTYRRVLVDSLPVNVLTDETELREYQNWVLDQLEQRYKLGIDLGVEDSYTLAKELAILYQEQAGCSPSETKYLQSALEYLELAESLYTGDPNHPIWEIYLVRIRILMAQHRYGDALKLLKSLPKKAFEDPSLATIIRLAAAMTGEKYERGEEPAGADGGGSSGGSSGGVGMNTGGKGAAGKDEQPPDQAAIIAALSMLFDNEGELLREYAAANPPLRTLLQKILDSFK